jgi:phenylacetic acid degradation operon negative regulatory protein
VSESITDDAGRPSRGRSVGLVAFLFGMIGEPTAAGPVLRRLLEDLGVSADAGRALLARMVRQGQLTSERTGRSTRYRLAGEFARAFERVRDQPQARPGAWSGRFHGLLYHVPERDRDFRDALRRAAILAGYGLLQQGVLIAVTDRSAVLAATLDQRPPGTRVWLTTLAMDAAQAAEAASLAWNLPGLGDSFTAHIRRLAEHPAPDGDGPDALRSYVDVLLPALTDTLRQPTLPHEVLPADWPGAALREAIDQFQNAHGPATQGYVRRLVDSDQAPK